MAIGKPKRQVRFEDPVGLLGDRLRGIYRLLADHGDVLFPEDYFADCYKRSVKGRPTVPARVLATVMVLQALKVPNSHRPVILWVPPGSGSVQCRRHDPLRSPGTTLSHSVSMGLRYRR
jgi:hypothetical protein